MGVTGMFETEGATVVTGVAVGESCFAPDSTTATVVAEGGGRGRAAVLLVVMDRLVTPAVEAIVARAVGAAVVVVGLRAHRLAARVSMLCGEE